MWTKASTSIVSVALSLVLLAAAPHAAASAVGALQGEASVDPTGAANYQVPLIFPKGTAGMQPEMAFLYSSRAGNGHLGQGWSLTGLSSITRCPRTKAQDNVRGFVNYDSNDKFCLDGQRLKLETGGTYGGNGVYYRTEIDSFQRVRSIGGSSPASPAYFVVQDKAGLTRYYGRDGTTGPYNGYINVASSSSTTLNNMASSWAIARIEDKHGNYIRYSYTENVSTGEYYPSEITYFNKNNVQIGRAAFTYDSSRTDKSYSYGRLGSKRTLTARLTHVTIYGRSSTVVRQYRLTYRTSPNSKLSQLDSIKLCSGSSGGASCLAPLDLSWEDGQKGFHTNTGLLTWPANTTNKFLDINGDGRTDNVLFDDHYIKYKLGGSDSYVTSIYLSDSYNFRYSLVLDHNRDGLQDLLIPNHNGYWYLLKSTGTGFTIQSLSIPHANSYDETPALIDIDNDGHVDLLMKSSNRLKYVRSNGVPIGTTTASRAVVTTGFTINHPQNLMPIEYDGLPGTEVYVASNDCSYSTGGGGGGGGGGVVLLSVGGTGPADAPTTQFGSAVTQPDTTVLTNGNLLTEQSSASTNGDTSTSHCMATSGVLFWNGASLEDVPTAPVESTPVMIDINGDGLTDIGRKYQDTLDNFNWKWDIYLNKGGSFELKTVGFLDKDPDKFQVVDYNLDGKADILAAGQTYFTAIYERAGTIYTETTTIPRSQQAYITADINGDGLSDLMYLSGSSNPNWNRWTHKGQKPDLLTTVTDGFGKRVGFNYGSLSDMRFDDRLYGGHLTGGADVTQAAINHLRAPIMVVESVATDSGYLTTGGSSKVNTIYTYSGAKTDIDGRGFLGFHKIESRNSNSPVHTINYHSQTFPYTGMVEKTEQFVSAAPSIVVTAAQLGNYLGACDTVTGSYDEGCYESAIATYQLEMASSHTMHKLSESTMTHARHRTGTSQSTYRYFPYASTSVEKTYKMSDGQLVKIVTTNNTYSTFGNPTNISVTTTDGVGGDIHSTVTTNVYQDWADARWCLARLTDVDVTHTRHNYGARNTAPLSETRESSFTYDSTHCQLTSETVEPNDQASKLHKTYGFDQFGNRTSVTESGGSGLTAITTVTSSMQYDSAGQHVVSTSNALSHTTATAWNNDFGVPTSKTDVNGYTTTYLYDEFGRETKVTAPRTTVHTSTFREWCSAVGCKAPGGRGIYRVRKVGSDGSKSWAEFDMLGREVISYKNGFDGQLIMAQTRYDMMGRDYASSAPYFENASSICWSVKTYDTIDRVVGEYAHGHQSQCVGTEPMAPDAHAPTVYAQGRNSTYVYDGLKTTATDPQGRVIERVNNSVGRLRTLSEWNGVTKITTAYDYDPLGNKSLVRDHAGKYVDIAYDKRGNKDWMQDPNLGTWTYVTDVKGRLRTQTDAKGQTTTLTYDQLDRLLTRTEAEGTTTWVYDAIIHPTTCTVSVGRLVSVYGPNSYQENYCYRATGGFHGEQHYASQKVDGTWHSTVYYYDSFGRNYATIYPSTLNSSIGDWSYRLRLDHEFNANGYYFRSRDRSFQNGAITVGAEYYKVLATDAFGNVTSARKGGNIDEYRSYDRATGVLNTLQAGSLASGNAATGLQNMHYGWDMVGNLMERIDMKRSVAEGYDYDELNRLEATRFYQNQTSATGTATDTITNTFDNVGNITKKGDFTGYTYWSNRPNAVKNVSTSAGLRTYNYDQNGNISSVTGGNAAKTITWSSFNKPTLISKDATTYSEFKYAPSRARYQQKSKRGNGTLETTTYWGGILDTTVKTNSSGGEISRENLHYISVPGAGVVATVKTIGQSSWNGRETRYLLRDHQGSVVGIVNEGGAEVEAYAFDPWGKRRVATNWNDFGSPGVFMTNTYLARGYTGHEHLDHLGLIHMNGRVYDPELGRFLSADPNIQFPESTQGFNRYTYVGNNPMSYSDPSGFFIKKLMKIASFAMNFAPIPGLGTIANGFVQGFLASGGDIKAGFFGAVSAGLASGIGESNAKLFGSELLGKGALHGISQGAITTAGGGRFGDGFLGAFASKMLSPLTEKIAGEYQTGDSNDIVARAAVSAAIGGTASKLGGGKFSNGALSASFVSVYNGDDFGSFLDVADPVLRFLSDSGVPDVASTLQDAVDESIAETSETLEHLAEASEPEVTVSGSGRLGTMNGSVSVSLDPDGYSTSVEGGMATLPKNPKDYIDLELLVDASANIYRTAPPPPSDAYPVKIGFSGDAGYFGIRIYRQSWYGENGVPTGRWVVRGRVGNPQFGAGMAVSN